MVPPFYEQVRAANGPYVTVEVDDVVGTAGPVLGILALVAARLHLTEGPCRVRVGINRGSALDIIDRGYRNVAVADSVARALAEAIQRDGLEAVKAWDENPSNWRSPDTTKRLRSPNET